ncbi:MAG: hypothetical protein NTW86_26280 [Candidatus Sumerlaeota bacterium]|nr:hypothetical protein [Candidatus Sumerlaeota bacterium]
MRFLTTVIAFDSITGDKEIAALRQLFIKKIKAIRDSGKLIEGGAFVDARGGFLLLDVDSAAELQELLAPLHDVAHIQARAINMFDDLGKLLKKLG